jgi:hypothetical protein
MMAVLRTHRSRLSSTAIAAIVSSPGVTPHHAAGDRAAPAATTRVRLSCAVAPPPRLPTGYSKGTSFFGVAEVAATSFSRLALCSSNWVDKRKTTSAL